MDTITAYLAKNGVVYKTEEEALHADLEHDIEQILGEYSEKQSLDSENSGFEMYRTLSEFMKRLIDKKDRNEHLMQIRYLLKKTLGDDK